MGEHLLRADPPGGRSPARAAQPAPLRRRPDALRAEERQRGLLRRRPALRAHRGHCATRGRRLGARPGPGTEGAAMEFLTPADWAEALQAKAAHPDAVPIAGGTDVMVGLNFDPRRPAALLDLGRVAELGDWEVSRRRRPDRRGGDLRPAPAPGPRRPPAGAGHRGAHRRLAPDPQPGDPRRQPGDGVAGRRRAPGSAGRRRRGRSRVRPGRRGGSRSATSSPA